MLQAFGDLYAMVNAGAGERMEWSVRFMRANVVMGMWHETHLLPGLPALWRVWASAFFTLFAWQGMQASFAFSSARNR
jgi:hypothetical protein